MTDRRRNNGAARPQANPQAARPGDPRAFSPASQRNRQPILEVLARILPGSGLVLEVASGSGEHALWFAQHLRPLAWQPSDPDPAGRRSIAAHAATERAALLEQTMAVQRRWDTIVWTGDDTTRARLWFQMQQLRFDQDQLDSQVNVALRSAHAASTPADPNFGRVVPSSGVDRVPRHVAALFH